MKTLTLLFLLVNLHLLAQSKQDTINFYPIAEFNLSFGKTELNFKQLETYDYKFAWDIFNLILNSPSNELGENGKPVNLNFNFIDMRSSNFFLNGRSLNGYIYPYQLFHMLPLDNIYKIEILYNFSSSIFQNSNSSASNFIFKNIFTQRPITRVRYIEDAYDFIATDVSFTHNFHKNLNLTFGFRRSVSAGRFTNSQHDAWNFFINSFWIPLKNLKISLLNIYTTVKTGLNGGIDTMRVSPSAENIIYNERIASVIEEASSLLSKRNDLTISSLFQVNSISVIDFILYHTFQTDKLTLRKDPNERNSNFYGLRLNFKTSISSAEMNMGFEIQKNNLKISLLNDTLATGYIPSGSKSISSFSAFLNSRFSIGYFNIYPFVRVENLSGEMSLNYGLGVEMNLKNLKPYAGFSHSHRIPTLFEQFISGSSDFEKHQVYEAGLKVKGGNFSLDIKIQNRRVFDFLVFCDSISYRTYIKRTFGEANFSFKLWKLNLDLNSSLILNKIPKPYPKYLLKAEFYFEGKLTRTLIVKLGARARASDKFNSFRFINSSLLFVESRYEMKKFTTIDLFISGRVKNAVIFLTFANITNARYMTTAFYPMQDRSLRFGVIWTFFD